MKEKKYFTVGEFAQLFGISKQTLFYYERNHIFAPAFVNENGYRYYSFAQFYIFEIISALRAAHVPLKKIAWYLEHRDVAGLRALFTEKQREYTEALALIQKNMRHIETHLGRLSLIDALETGQFPAISLMHVEARTLVTTPYPAREMSTYQSLHSLSVHNEKLRRRQGINENPTGYLLPKKALETGKYMDYSCYFTDVTEPEEYDDILIKPAGLYATLYKRMREYPVYTDAIDALKNFITANGFRIAGDAYITPIRSFWTTENPEDYITKIVILVKEKQD